MMGLDRIEADGPLERTAARSIPKPCLEAGHRIVPTCQASRFMSTWIGPIVPRSSFLILSHQTVDS